MQTKICSMLAKKFDAISVREEFGVKLCKDHFGVDATWVLDPTLLLKKEDYLPICKDVSVNKEKYLAVYVLDESETIPSPMLQSVCRKFVEKGADLVVCQHSHCIGCEEKFLSGTIVYGQGNFVFDSCNTPTSQMSLLVKIDKNFNVEYIPLEKHGCGVRLAKDDVAKRILSGFYQRSEQIKNAEFIEIEYSKFAKKMVNAYLLTCSGYGHKLLIRVLNKLSRYKITSFIIGRFKKKELLAIRNFVECESHRELFVRGLKKII